MTAVPQDLLVDLERRIDIMQQAGHKHVPVPISTVRKIIQLVRNQTELKPSPARPIE